MSANSEQDPNDFGFDIPSVEDIKDQDNDPSTYLLSDEIKGAVKAAMKLGQPLFITGEPGTGKTALANKIAHAFQLTDEEGKFRALKFNTKTTTTAQDLFYKYDAVRHFRDANMKQGVDIHPMSYIELQALGKAIAFTDPASAKEKGIELAVDKPQNVVVLIDEIDKAPADFPNDILHEIENLAFEIRETGTVIKADKAIKPFVIMTSNSEKSMPDAFLRRCVFLHIEFPKAKLLTEIVQKKLSNAAYVENAEAFVAHFEEVRKEVKKKKPATAELIGWIRMLEMEDFFNGSVDFDNLSEEQKKKLKFSYSVLAKNKDDYNILIDHFGLDR